MYIRKEALVSSQIEGTQCTLDDVLNPEADTNANLDVSDVIMRRLVEQVIDKAEKMGYGAVLLGGNPKLYARFGFEPSNKYGIYHKDREKWGMKVIWYAY